MTVSNPFSKFTVANWIQIAMLCGTFFYMTVLSNTEHQAAIASLDYRMGQLEQRVSLLTSAEGDVEDQLIRLQVLVEQLVEND